MLVGKKLQHGDNYFTFYTIVAMYDKPTVPT
jgi:hypothetical protein